MLLNNFALLDLSTPDLLIILAIIFLLFGAKRLPELSKSLGTSARELRKGFTDIQEAHGELKDQVKQVTATVTPNISAPITSLAPQQNTPSAAMPQARSDTPVQL